MENKNMISMFEDIKHIDANGNEYWYARELQKVLEYSQWRRFNAVIEKAKVACLKSSIEIGLQFANIGKLSKNVNGGNRRIDDYKLSRYACYLIAQNGDSRKKVIALAQTYFAVKTRERELSEKEFLDLSEDERRILERKKVLYNIKYRLGGIKMAKKENDCKKVFEIKIEGDKWAKAQDKAFDKAVKNITIDGFRKGKCPRDVFEKKYGMKKDDILKQLGSTEMIKYDLEMRKVIDLLKEANK